MNKILWPVLLALVLSACGTTSGTKATVEDRTGAKADAAMATAGQAGSAGATGAGVETTALGGKGVPVKNASSAT